MTKTVITYLVLGGIVTTGFAGVQFTGWEPGTPKREIIPPNARESPGGYRSYHFWSSGWMGGK